METKNIIDGLTVVHCNTRDDYLLVLTKLNKLGTRYDDVWSVYKEDSCFRLNTIGNHADLKYYQRNEYTIISSQEFLKRVGNSQGVITPVVNNYPIF